MLKIIKIWLHKLFRKSSDPVKVLPKTAMETIFGYLSSEEILKCSTVNKDWNKFIGKSSICMSKIRLCLCEPYNGMLTKFTSDDATFILSNGRKYKHIGMFITRNFSKDHLLVLASFKWQTMILCHHTFKSEIELINFIGLMEPYVEEIDLRFIKIVFSKQKEIAKTNFIFPRLRTLKLSHCYTFVHSEIFKNVAELKHLEIETGSQLCYEDDERDVIEKVKAMQSMLIKNIMIKQLTLFLHQTDFDNMFIDQRFLSRVRFQLETLKVKKFRKLIGRETNIVQVHNFGSFLRSHQNSMKSLHLTEWMGNDVLEIIINTMDNLKCLAINDLESYGLFDDSIANINWYKNESIEMLSIFAIHSKFNELQKCLLENVPNLKVLKIGTVNQKILDILVDKTQKLEVINTDYFTAYIPPERAVLHYLRKMTIRMSYAGNFKDMLRDYTNYTNFESVFLKAVWNFHKRN